MFPAFTRLSLVAPEYNWNGLRQSGLDLVKVAHFGPSNLTSDWISAKGEQPRPADKFKPVFGYNALRIPLYLAWAGVGNREHYAPFVALWGQRNGLATIDVTSGRPVDQLSEPGFGAIADLTMCAVGGPNGKAPPIRNVAANQNYYPASLHLMALIAAQMRYPACLPR